MKIILFSMCFFLGLSRIASAGVFGVGNTSDLSLQLQFAKSNAITFLKIIDLDQFRGAITDERSIQFYQQCRQTMFLSALRTEFEIVDAIPDGGEYHAVMRRKKGVIQASRSAMESLAKNGQFTAYGLTAQVLHELGHDCVYQGQRVDDRFDPILDKVGEGLAKAATSQSMNYYRSVDFIQKVKHQKPVDFFDLASEVRAVIAQKYLDYVGDWAFVTFRSEFGPSIGSKNTCEERPAPASQFYATLEDSLYVGWGHLPLRLATPQMSLEKAARYLLQSSFESKGITYFDGKLNRSLPTNLKCTANQKLGIDGARCLLQILWPNLQMASGRGVRLYFTTDLLGTAAISKVEVF